MASCYGPDTDGSCGGVSVVRFPLLVLFDIQFE